VVTPHKYLITYVGVQQEILDSDFGLILGLVQWTEYAIEISILYSASPSLNHDMDWIVGKPYLIGLGKSSPWFRNHERICASDRWSARTNLLGLRRPVAPSAEQALIPMCWDMTWFYKGATISRTVVAVSLSWLPSRCCSP